MTEALDLKLTQLKTLEDQLTLLGTEKETLRKEVMEIIKSENLDQYKNDVATISQVERKTLKYTKTPEEILQEIENQKLAKYIEVIPEHKGLNKQFEKDVKEGVMKIEGVEIEVSSSPMIRFNK
jgi:hypothetical protein